MAKVKVEGKAGGAKAPPPTKRLTKAAKAAAAKAAQDASEAEPAAAPPIDVVPLGRIHNIGASSGPPENRVGTNGCLDSISATEAASASGRKRVNVVDPAVQEQSKRSLLVGGVAVDAVLLKLNTFGEVTEPAPTVVADGRWFEDPKRQKLSAGRPPRSKVLAQATRVVPPEEVTGLEVRAVDVIEKGLASAAWTNVAGKGGARITVEDPDVSNDVAVAGTFGQVANDTREDVKPEENIADEGVGSNPGAGPEQKPKSAPKKKTKKVTTQQVVTHADASIDAILADPVLAAEAGLKTGKIKTPKPKPVPGENTKKSSKKSKASSAVMREGSGPSGSEGDGTASEKSSSEKNSSAPLVNAPEVGRDTEQNATITSFMERNVDTLPTGKLTVTFAPSLEHLQGDVVAEDGEAVFAEKARQKTLEIKAELLQSLQGGGNGTESRWDSFGNREEHRKASAFEDRMEQHGHAHDVSWERDVNGKPLKQVCTVWQVETAKGEKYVVDASQADVDKAAAVRQSDDDWYDGDWEDGDWDENDWMEESILPDDEFETFPGPDDVCETDRSMFCIQEAEGEDVSVGSKADGSVAEESDGKNSKGVPPNGEYDVTEASSEPDEVIKAAYRQRAGSGLVLDEGLSRNVVARTGRQLAQTSPFLTRRGAAVGDDP